MLKHATPWGNEGDVVGWEQFELGVERGTHEGAMLADMEVGAGHLE